MATVLTAEDKKWRAQSDARTLMDVERINADPPRLKLAIKEVNKLKLEKEAELKALKKIAKQN